MRRTKKYKSSYDKIYKKCWKLWSLVIRLTYADQNGYAKCITCGKAYHYKDLHAGHLRHGVLDFDAKNIHPQCQFCNTYNGGQRDLYYIEAVKRYGQDEVDDLYQRASRASIVSRKDTYPEEYLEKFAVELTLKTTELMKEKAGGD